MNTANVLESKRVGRLLLKLSVPAVIGMLVNALYSIVDRVFIGRGVGSIIRSEGDVKTAMNTMLILM